MFERSNIVTGSIRRTRETSAVDRVLIPERYYTRALLPRVLCRRPALWQRRHAFPVRGAACSLRRALRNASGDWDCRPTTYAAGPPILRMRMRRRMRMYLLMMRAQGRIPTQSIALARSMDCSMSYVAVESDGITLTLKFCSRLCINMFVHVCACTLICLCMFVRAWWQDYFKGWAHNRWTFDKA